MKKHLMRLVCSIVTVSILSSSLLGSIEVKAEPDINVNVNVSIPDNLSVNVKSISEGLKEKDGLKVYVVNEKEKGELFLNKINVINNLTSMDYRKKDFKYKKQNCDLVEIYGDEYKEYDYMDMLNVRCNYLIEKGVYSRYYNLDISGSNIITSDLKPDKFVKKSDLLMALVKSYEGVHEKEIILEKDLAKETQNAKNYKFRAEVKQDFFNSDLSISNNKELYYYYSANNKSTYMERAVKLGLIESKEIRPNIGEQVKSFKSEVHESDMDVLENEIMTYYQALSLIKQLVEFKESKLTEEEEQKINYYFGNTLDSDIPSDMRGILEYLLAKGILNSRSNLTDHEFTFDDFIELMFYVKNEGQRYTLKNMVLTAEDKDLIERGYRKSTMKIIDNNVSMEQIFGKKTQEKQGNITVQKEMSYFKLKDFFTTEIKNFIKTLKNNSGEEMNLEEYGSRFYFSIKGINSNYLGVRGEDYYTEVENDDLVVKVEKGKLKHIQSVSEALQKPITLRSSEESYLPKEIEGITTEGILEIENGKIKGVIDYAKVPQYFNSTGEAGVYLITQELYMPSKEGNASWFLFHKPNDPENGKRTLMDVCAEDPNDDNKVSEPIVEGNTTKLTVQFKSIGTSPEHAIAQFRSCIDINPVKWKGFKMCQGFIQASGKTVGKARESNRLVGKDFLTYFGDIDIIADKALINRVTGTYALLIDGKDMSSHKQLNTAIVGNTIKRYSPSDKFIASKINGEMFYNENAIKELLPSMAYSYSGDKNIYFGKGATEKTVDLKTVIPRDVDGSDTENWKGEIYYSSRAKTATIQKNYLVTYNGTNYLNLNHLNYAGNNVIIDLDKIERLAKEVPENIKNKVPNTNLKLDSRYKMIVSWQWYIPQEAVKDKKRYIGNYNDLIEVITERPKKKELAEFWDINTALTDNILNMAIGTTNMEYSTTGYMVPRLTVLAPTEDESIGKYVQNLIFDYFLEPSISKWYGGRADFEGAQFSINEATKICRIPFWQYLHGKEMGDTEENGKGLLNFGSYVMDKKESVYVKLDNDLVSTGALEYKSSKDYIIVNPFQKGTDYIQLREGKTYTYQNSTNKGYVYLGNNAGIPNIGKSEYNYTEEVDPKNKSYYPFMKKLSDSYRLEGIPKDPVDTEEYKNAITKAMRDRLLEYSANDALIREVTQSQIAGLDYMYLMGLLPWGSKVEKVDPDYKEVVRNNVFGDKAFICSTTDGYHDQFGGEYTTNSGGVKVPITASKQDVFAPVLNLANTDYKVVRIPSSVLNENGAYMAEGTIVKYRNEDEFTMLALTHPNFNMAQAWISSLLKNKKKLVELEIGSQVTINNSIPCRISEKDGKSNTVKLEGINTASLASVQIITGGKAVALSNFQKASDSKDSVWLSGDLTTVEAETQNGKVNHLVKNQDTQNGFNQELPFDMNLNIEQEDIFNFNYKGYKEEVPSNLQQFVDEFTKAMAEGQRKIHENIMLRLVVEILMYIVIVMWVAFLVVEKNIGYRPLMALKKQTRVDLLKIFSLWVFNLESDLRFLRISVATLLIMFIQGILLKFVQ